MAKKKKRKKAEEGSLELDLRPIRRSLKDAVKYLNLAAKELEKIDEEFEPICLMVRGPYPPKKKTKK